MTRQSPYAWPPQPAHGPQHAAAVSGKAVLGSRAHRAMKLFLIASVYFGVKAWQGQEVHVPLISDWLNERLPAN